MQKTFQPGSLVKLRNREWVVMPSSDEDLLVVKPLGGSDEETTGIFLPLAFKDEIPEGAEFPYPASKDIGNYTTANLLYDAARLSFRNVSGPFRCMGKLSFRPRSYQLVPLVMSLKQDFVRLLIADDVGVGKTIEALLIVRELLDRGEIKRFAVVCLPHLCEQWQQELKDKFSIDAVIIRSSTAAQLDRKIQGDGSIFREYPYQVVSIDFIKFGPKREIFLNECPEFIIVDEAHTCAKPDGQSVKQQQRHYLIHTLAAKPKQHLILMTATPHSGKQAEFQSLLGLLRTEFETIDLVNSALPKRKEVADHLIIRRRADVEQWLDERTKFPHRDSKEIEYLLSEDYKIILNDLLTFARKVNTTDLQTSSKKKFRYFAILSLLRGVMSSPQAGIEMLSKKASDISIDDFDDEVIQNPIADTEGTDSDALPLEILDKSELKKSEAKFLSELAEKLERVKDNKAAEALKVSLQWINEGFNPVVFCRFIETAKYLGDYFKSKLPKNTDLLVVTGEMVDEQRREKIDEFENSKNKKRILISTDCLSEGINLQKFFNAVLHYDLPWNPNRLEQREGRVDRFGQTSEEVKAYLLWGKDNPIDSVVLKILLRKAREIRKQTGISVPFPEDSQSILDSLLNAVILNPNAVRIDNQLEFFDDVDINDGEAKVTNAYEKASERDRITRSIFAQHSVKASEIEKDLKEVDEAVGNPVTVKRFVIDAVTNLGGQLIQYKSGYRLYTTNLNPIFKSIFNNKDEVLITFESPTPEDFLYIGRNSLFVEQLSHYVLNKSLISNGHKPIAARASVIPSKNIKTKTTIVQVRVRNIISDKTDGKQLVSEEMILWGYENNISERKFIKHEECKNLLAELIPSSDYERPRQEFLFTNEIEAIKKSKDVLAEIVRERSNKLIEAHERFRKLVGGSKYQLIEPVLPPDVLGIYIIMPQL